MYASDYSARRSGGSSSFRWVARRTAYSSICKLSWGCELRMLSQFYCSSCSSSSTSNKSSTLRVFVWTVGVKSSYGSSTSGLTLYSFRSVPPYYLLVISILFWSGSQFLQMPDFGYLPRCLCPHFKVGFESLVNYTCFFFSTFFTCFPIFS